MVTTAVAVVVVLVLSELAFAPQDTAFWRRWLGTASYMWRRALLGLVPVVAALIILQAMPQATGLGQQIIKGLLTGVTAAALLRANTGRVHLRAGDLKASDTRGATSALAWVYNRTCHRLDARAARRIHADLARQKVPGRGHPDELLSCAEELAGVLNQESHHGRTRALKTAAQERRDELRQAMDVLADPLANARQQQTAAFEIAEILGDELVKRRWDRRSAFTRRNEVQ